MKFVTIISCILLVALCANAQELKLKELLKGKTNFSEIEQIANAYFANRPNAKHPSKGAEEQDDEYVQYKRWQWQWKQRVQADGSFPDLRQQFEIYKDLNTSATQKKTRSTIWKPISQTTSIGGYSNMGRIVAMAFHPTDTNIIYVGAPIGGIWKTTNGGSSWIPLGDQLPYCSVGNIVVDHTNPSVLFITIGENGGWWNYGLGVYKSMDAGLHWTATSHAFNFTNQKVFYKLIMDPTNHNIMYCAENDGLWKTADGGTTWTNIKAGDFRDIEFKPNDNNTLYIASDDYWGSSEVYKSTDAGATWNAITNFAQQYTSIHLTVTNNDPNYLGMSIMGNGNSSFFLSTNAGTSFTLKNSNIDDDALLLFSPTNKNRVYCGGVSNFASDDAGATWSQITNWYNDGVLPEVHADNHVAYVNPINNKYIYIGNDGGFYKYNEQTDHWTDMSNGLVITQFYKIASSQQDSIFMIGGTQDNGGRKRISSTAWDATNGGDAMEVAINPNNDQTIYTTYYGGALYRSYDQWNADVYHDISADTNSGAWVTPYMLDPNNSMSLIAGYHDVWRTLDEGDTWAALSNNLTGTTNDLEFLDVAKSNSNVIYTGYQNNLYYTNNLGATWNSKAITNTNGIFENGSSVAVHPTKENKIYVTKSGYAANSKVYSSTNNGTTWKNISYNIPNVPVNCLLIDQKSDSLNVDMYIGTDVGVFYKKDSDMQWIYYGTGMPNTQVSDLDIFYPTGKLRAGTYGRGIWETNIARPLISVGLNTIPQSDYTIELLQNPVEQFIQMEVQLKSNRTLFFDVYDDQGKKMMHQEHAFVSGKSNFNLDVNQFAKGIYLLQVSDQHQGKKQFKVLKK